MKFWKPLKEEDPGTTITDTKPDQLTLSLAEGDTWTKVVSWVVPTDASADTALDERVTIAAGRRSTVEDFKSSSRVSASLTFP